MSAMPVSDEGSTRLPEAGSYFYLSYAHSLPLAGRHKAGPDPWVHRFFGDLAGVVRELAGRPQPAAGFYDQQIPSGADWKAALLDGLGGAQVLVPLYSPGYFNQSWSGREWACFAQRMQEAVPADPLDRIVPVLWVPLPRGRQVPGYQAALDLGADEPAYGENGMQALLRLGLYRDSYGRVLRKLAGQVVQIARRRPVRPAVPPDIESIDSPFSPESASAVLWIAVAAPTAATPGSKSADWRPYPREQTLALSAYAAWRAEQLDFAAQVTGLEDRPKTHNGPCIMLVDPKVAAEKPDRDHFRTTVADLPAWILPLLVLDDSADAKLLKLAETTRDMLVASVPDLTSAAIHSVASFDEFLEVVPVLVAEAERRYIRYGPAPVPVDMAIRRYRLGMSAPRGEQSDD
jgi:hypothetical protein